MKRFSEQFKKKSDTIRLRVSERADLRDRIESYMEYHPLPAELKTTPKKKTSRTAGTKTPGIVSEPFKVLTVNMTYIRNVAGVFVLFVVVGVPVLAEWSVPGDILYPVKTHFTEEVRASLTLSPYAKVEWETKRLERRVAEARLLASEGKLTPETEATVAQAVQEHTDAVTQEIALMRETNEDDAAIAEIAFASALAVQADVLEGYAEKVKGDEENNPDAITDQGHSITTLTDIVHTASTEAEVAQADATPSYEALLGIVETETTRAYELFNTIQKRAQADELADVERRLADVERKIVEAIALHDSEDGVEVVVPEDSEDTSGDTENALESSPTTIETVESIPEEGTVPTTTDAADTTDATTSAPAEENTTDISTEPDEVVADISDDTPEEEGVPQPQQVAKDKNAKAIALLRVALRDIKKLILFMTDIDIRENISVEELVPVTPTDEERIAAIVSTRDEVLRIQKEITRRIESADTTNEKVTFGMEKLDEYLTTVADALRTKNIPAGEQAIQEAYAMAVDIQKLVTPLEERKTDTQTEENTPDDTSSDQESPILPEATTTTSAQGTSTNTSAQPNTPTPAVSGPSVI